MRNNNARLPRAPATRRELYNFLALQAPHIKVRRVRAHAVKDLANVTSWRVTTVDGIFLRNVHSARSMRWWLTYVSIIASAANVKKVGV